MGAPFRHRIRVRYSECDQQGVVFYPNYLAWFDIAMTELSGRGAIPTADMTSAGVDMVVAEAACATAAPPGSTTRSTSLPPCSAWAPPR